MLQLRWNNKNKLQYISLN